MNSRKSLIVLSITLLTLCLFALSCSTGGNTNNTTSNTSSNTTSNTGKQDGAGNSSSPTTNGSPSASPLPLPNSLTGSDSWLQFANSVKEKVGQRYTFTCSPNGKLRDSVYGTDVYYTGSSICSAAVHAGIITVAQGGQVTIEIKPALYPYVVSERNGVTSRPINFSDQKDNGSFVFIKP